MRYYKLVADGYITAFGTGGTGGEEITERDYATLCAAMTARPAPQPRQGYRLRTDLTWEAYPLPEEPAVYAEADLSAMRNAELEAILYSLGVSVSMTKANMIRLILAVQGGSL